MQTHGKWRAEEESFTIDSDGLSSITLFHKISGLKTGSFTFSC